MGTDATPETRTPLSEPRERVVLDYAKDAPGPCLVVVAGLHGDEPGGGLVDVERCLVQHDDANAVLATARELILEGDAKPHRLIIRRSCSSGRILVALRGGGRSSAGSAEPG